MSFDFQLRELILKFVVDNNLAFRISRSKSFRDLLNGISGREIPLPAATTFTVIMANQYEETKSKVIELLSKAIKVCTTTDAWSARGQHFVGMTAHVIDENTLARRSFLLAFRIITGRLTYDVLGRQIHEIHSEFRLGIEKLTFTLTDGGSNYCKAFRMFGINSEEIDQIVIPVDEQEIEQGNEQEIEQEMIDNDSDSDEIAEDDDLNDIDIIANQLDLESIQSDEYAGESSDFIFGPDDIVLPKQMRCCAHLLCLSNGKDFDDALPTATSKALNTCLCKLRRVWSLLSYSNIAKEACKNITGQILPVPNATRWNAKYDAIKAVLGVKDKVNRY